MDSSDIVKLMPFATLLGIDITSASAEAVTATLEHRADLCTTADILHGGALMTLADTTGARRARDLADLRSGRRPRWTQAPLQSQPLFS